MSPPAADSPFASPEPNLGCAPAAFSRRPSTDSHGSGFTLPADERCDESDSTAMHPILLTFGSPSLEAAYQAHRTCAHYARTDVQFLKVQMVVNLIYVIILKHGRPGWPMGLYGAVLLLQAYIVRLLNRSSAIGNHSSSHTTSGSSSNTGSGSSSRISPDLTYATAAHDITRHTAPVSNGTVMGSSGAVTVTTGEATGSDVQWAPGSMYLAYRRPFLLVVRCILELLSHWGVLSWSPVPQTAVDPMGLKPFLRITLITTCIFNSWWMSLAYQQVFRVHLIIQVIVTSSYIMHFNQPICHGLELSAEGRGLVEMVWQAITRFASINTRLGRVSALPSAWHAGGAAILQLPPHVSSCWATLTFMQLALGLVGPSLLLHHMEARSRRYFLQSGLGIRATSHGRAYQLALGTGQALCVPMGLLTIFEVYLLAYNCLLDCGWLQA